MLGDFHGPQRVGADKHPTHKQLSSLEKLLDHLKAHPDLTIGSKEIYGHKDFGKKNCPGIAISRFLNEYNANI